MSTTPPSTTSAPLAATVPTQTKGLLGALATFVSALLAVMTSLEWVHWNAAQIALVSAESAAAFALLTALVAHYSPNTKQEPVAIAAAATALVSATLALGVGFAWWELKAEQQGALVAVVGAAIGVGSALVARQFVTAEQKPTTPAAG